MGCARVSMNSCLSELDVLHSLHEHAVTEKHTGNTDMHTHHRRYGRGTGTPRYTWQCNWRKSRCRGGCRCTQDQYARPHPCNPALGRCLAGLLCVTFPAKYINFKPVSAMARRALLVAACASSASTFTADAFTWTAGTVWFNDKWQAIGSHSRSSTVLRLPSRRCRSHQHVDAVASRMQHPIAEHGASELKFGAQMLSLKKPTELEGTQVPATMETALHRFFWGNENAPRFLVSALFVCGAVRMAMGMAGVWPVVGISDAFVGGAVVVFWAFQEWWLHKYLLHAPFKWMGTEIHVGHHQRAFYHVSIDSMSLVVPWFMVATGLLHVLFPAHLALTATTAYTGMGLFYEFTHYLAHTKAQPKSLFLSNIKRHHMRHHLVDDRFWHTFSWTEIDSIMGTAPTGSELHKLAKERRAAASGSEDFRR